MAYQQQLRSHLGNRLGDDQAGTPPAVIVSDIFDMCRLSANVPVEGAALTQMLLDMLEDIPNYMLATKEVGQFKFSFGVKKNMEITDTILQVGSK